MLRSSLLLFVAGCALSCAACSSNGLHSVSGQVLYQGSPAAGASVYFHRTTPGDTPKTVYSAVVLADGSFRLTGPDGDGALPGDYVVLVDWKKGAGETPGRAPGLNAPDRLEGRYMDIANPRLTATVKAGSNKLPPFTIE